ncbi:hypothetical protein AUC61_22680 [Pseudomonas sp. S25]|uniref:Uncharacterized protein n=1 Tax=Pseudomonas maioricensis TaxID=1766623 RepID=A0ABS9ZR24_9PSED|nr:hypothetical protein [Pseudomonas sp. S25]MCI8212343.1 hypothetical protein [Pseudomonas sp. S25]
MNLVSVRYTGPADSPFPALGQGLWVNNLLDDADAAIKLIEQLHSAHLELLVDLRSAAAFDQLRSALQLCANAATDVWLLAVVDDQWPQAQLSKLAELMRDSSAAVRGILLTPAAYLESYQPGGCWPEGLTPTQVAVLAREYLPEMLIGGGFPTFFTELNRCRPASDSFDYLTHSTSPLVHAADDYSLMQSLEALPDVFRSGLQLASGKPYRITTSAIGAWRNPYGGQLTPNPKRERLTLSNQDPRQTSLLAAAWTLAHYQAAHLGAVNAIALWAVNEPFAVAHAHQYWPVFHVLKGLARARGKQALSFHTSVAQVIAFGWLEGAQGNVRLWLANLSAKPQKVTLDAMRVTGSRLLDEQTCQQALSDPDFFSALQPIDNEAALVLRPWTVALIDCHLGREPGL